MAKWTLAIVSALAAGLSCYLLLTSLTDTRPIGCGEGLLDCESVLATRWSTWLGLPVSAAAVAVYATLAGVAALSTRQLPERVESLTHWLLIGLIGIVAVASVWFLTLQGVVLGKFCLYCTVIHGCGLVVGMVGLLGLGMTLRKLTVALAAGVLVGAVLMGGQVTSYNVPPVKQRYRISGAPDLKLSRPIVIPWEQSRQEEAEEVSVLQGQLRIREDSRPLLGNRQAPIRVVKLFDYTCGHCRLLHGQLAELVQRRPARYGIVLVHVPLDPECNPYREGDSARHAQACELARLALAVWLEDPAAFASFDQWLCSGEKSRTEAAARDQAIRLIGEQQLEQRLAEPRLQEMLVENVDLYAFPEIALLPSMLTENRIIGGSFAGVNELEQVLNEE